jgi:hypothetical protein
VINAEHEFSSFLPEGENVLVGELFSRFFRNTFSRYRADRKKYEEKYDGMGLRVREKNREEGSTKSAQFFSHRVDE